MEDWQTISRYIYIYNNRLLARYFQTSTREGDYMYMYVYRVREMRGEYICRCDDESVKVHCVCAFWCCGIANLLYISGGILSCLL